MTAAPRPLVSFAIFMPQKFVLSVMPTGDILIAVREYIYIYIDQALTILTWSNSSLTSGISEIRNLNVKKEQVFLEKKGKKCI